MSKITFTQNRRITAIVDQTLEYTVDAKRVKEVMAEMVANEEAAIEYLLSIGECECNQGNKITEVDELLEIHESNIDV